MGAGEHALEFGQSQGLLDLGAECGENLELPSVASGLVEGRDEEVHAAAVDEPEPGEVEPDRLALVCARAR